MYNSRMLAGRRKDWTTQEVGSTSPKIKDLEAKFSELRKNWKTAASKCREDIRKDVNQSQGTTRGAMSRLNLWKMQQGRMEQREPAEHIMAGALLTSIAKMRSAARKTTVESICSDTPYSPRALSLRMASSRERSFRTSRFFRSASMREENKKLDDHNKPRSPSARVGSSSSDSCRRSMDEEKSSDFSSSTFKQSSTPTFSQRASSIRLSSSPPQKRKVPAKVTMEIPLSEMIEGSSSSRMSSPRYSNLDYGEADKSWRESSQRLRSKMRAWPVVDSDDFLDIDLEIEDIPDVPR
jgi:hypothetical protein